MQKLIPLLGYLLRLELIYYLILPYLAHLSILNLDEMGFWGVITTVIFGWVFLLIHQSLYYSTFPTDAKERASQLQSLQSLLPIIIVLYNQFLLSGTIWHVFLEKLLVEIIALLTAFCIALVIIKKTDKQKTLYSTLGSSFMIAMFFLCIGVWEFFENWLYHHIGTQNYLWHHFINVIVAILISTYSFYNRFKKIVTEDIQLEKKYIKNTFYRLVALSQIIIWIVLIPMLNKWLQ
ncbi:MAG: hypothetical protein EAZ55_09385 [Cytophagales bacterium]|nr:MAG: hypothetical protein EAZ55_09385 [Cytophagales bacterium]